MQDRAGGCHLSGTGASEGAVIDIKYEKGDHRSMTKYFKLYDTPELKYAPRIMDLYGKLDIRDIQLKTYPKLPERLVLNSSIELSTTDKIRLKQGETEMKLGGDLYLTERKDYTIQMCKNLNVKNEVIEKLEGK